MTDMIDIQQAAVADHIAGLARERAALRAERDRDHLREHATAPDDALSHRADLPNRRVRVGRWLVSVGVAIAGRGLPAGTAQARTAPATGARSLDPCGDSSDRLQRAA